MDANERVTKGNGIMESVEPSGKTWQECKNPSRQAMIVNIYDDMVVFERHEVGQGGKLGPDWVMPLNWGTGNWERDTGKHPFSRAELTKTLGAPEFPNGAKLAVASAMSRVVSKDNGELVFYRGKDAKDAPAVPVMRVTIPCADGNPASRPYAYDVVVVGDDLKARLFKNIYWPGCNLGVGREPDHGITTMDIPKSELPAGKKLTVAVRPLSSLGTAGRAIATTWRV